MNTKRIKHITSEFLSCMNYRYLLLKLDSRGIMRLPDEKYLKILFRERMGKNLDLKNPQTYNEKLQWLKLYNRNPLYTQLVDKYEVKRYVAEKIGGGYIIPTLGIWERFDDIEFATLPNQFVLKCTHDSGGIVICKDKSTLDLVAAREKITNSLNHNYYYAGREWPYKDVKPRIIAEEYIVDESGYELKDYKFFCFDGIPKVMFIASDRQKANEDVKFDFYDMDFNFMPIRHGHLNSGRVISKPETFETMKELAVILSANLPHVRVDFYDVNGQVYFGELTFYHHNGTVPFEPDEWDYTFGEWLKLPSNN